MQLQQEQERVQKERPQERMQWHVYRLMHADLLHRGLGQANAGVKESDGSVERRSERTALTREGVGRARKGETRAWGHPPRV